MTQVFLSPSNNLISFPDPGNWNPVNTVECIGAGGSGGTGLSAGSGGGGGAGGAYAKGTNLTPTFPVMCSAPFADSPTYYCSFNTPAMTSFANTAGSVSASSAAKGQNGVPE
jgi:hypothetical protein